MMPLRNRKGLSLVEILIAVAISALVLGTMARFMPQKIKNLRYIRERAQANIEARIVMDTLLQTLRKGQPQTLDIDTPAGGPPNSRARFVGTDGQTYLLGWDFSKQGTVILQIGAMEPKTLARNVTGITFAGDSRDPAIVTVSLRLDIPLDARNTATIFLPNQTVRMAVTP